MMVCTQVTKAPGSAGPLQLPPNPTLKGGPIVRCAVAVASGHAFSTHAAVIVTLPVVPSGVPAGACSPSVTACVAPGASVPMGLVGVSVLVQPAGAPACARV